MRWKPRTDYERFIEKVSFGFGDDACWTWLGAYQSDGYGSFGIKKSGKWRMILAHKFSYSHFVGEVPDGIEVCHKCDNRACVNPSHLFLGTQLDNIQDAKSKGRIWDRSGEKNPKAKLTEDEVTLIRQPVKDGFPVDQLSERFGVSETNIRAIFDRKIWNGLP